MAGSVEEVDDDESASKNGIGSVNVPNRRVFPQPKTPAIAGAQGEVCGLKIDLSKLFGGDSGESAIDMAVRERDRELILDGRVAVGMSIGIKQKVRDEIDQLIADLDALEF